jgi:hypothetical protein
LGANATVTNITGSIISGSIYRGSYANITTIVGNTVSGSTVYGSTISTPVLYSTNASVTNLTGSGTVSGSLLRASDFSGSHLGISGNAVINGNISGSTISGSITMDIDANARLAVRQNSSGTGYKRRRINFVEGSSISISLGDDAANEEVDVTISAQLTGSALLLDRIVPSNAMGEGIKTTGVAGEALTTGSVVYLKTDGKYYKASASFSIGSGSPAIGISLGSINSLATGSILLSGTMRYDSWSWGTTGSLLYVAGATGSLTTTAPATSGYNVQIMGVVVNTTTILLNPNLATVTLT